MLGKICQYLRLPEYVLTKNSESSVHESKGCAAALTRAAPRDLM